MLLLVCRRIRARFRPNTSMMSEARRCFRRSASCLNITSPAPRSIFWIEVAPTSPHSSDRTLELIGLGTGAGTKTRILIEALENPAVYIPVDISQKTTASIDCSFPENFPRFGNSAGMRGLPATCGVAFAASQTCAKRCVFPGIDHRQLRAR